MVTDFPRQWEEIEQRFPGSSAAFDRDLGEGWLAGRDGPRFEIHGSLLKVFAGASDEHGHLGPWASAYFDAPGERWIIARDERRATDGR